MFEPSLDFAMLTIALLSFTAKESKATIQDSLWKQTFETFRDLLAASVLARQFDDLCCGTLRMH